MSITWEEPGRGEWVTVEQKSAAAWKKVAGQVAALAILAVIGGAGGAGIAAWKLGDRAVVTEAAAGTGPAVEATAAEPLPAPRRVDAAPMVREAAPAPVAPVEQPTVAPAGPSRVTELFPQGETVLVADAAPAAAEPAVLVDAAATVDAPLAAPAATLAVQAGPADLPLPGIDVAETASILSPGEPVAVADTKEEAARLEAMMADESEPPAPDELAASAVSSAGKPLSPARADKYVNLRAAPDNDAEVVEIVPANAELLAEEDCVHWCAVVHDGKEGYIYKDFIRR